MLALDALEVTVRLLPQQQVVVDQQRRGQLSWLLSHALADGDGQDLCQLRLALLRMAAVVPQEAQLWQFRVRLGYVSGSWWRR